MFTQKIVEKSDETTTVKYYYCGFNVLTKIYAANYRSTKIFGAQTSFKVLDEATKLNSLDLQKLFWENDESRPKDIKIDIIIPIYNGFEYLEALFEGIKTNTDLDYRLIVVNDCSPDERVLEYLKKILPSFASVEFIQNEVNLGFVQSVNRAFKHSTNDVVILNTDVIVPKGWASRVIKPILDDRKVASVTPFSNAATMLSLPKIYEDNNFEGDLQVVDEALKCLNSSYANISLWTGVGFCMAINKDALSKIGGFDTDFGKGYGEENDWCIRAINAGFTNKLACNLFVWHKHGGSFMSQEKQDLLRKNYKILRAKHSNYKKMVNAQNSDSDFLTLRFIAELIYLNATTLKSELWFDHSWGGGTECYTFDQFRVLRDNRLCIRLQCFNRSATLSYYYKNFKNKILFKDIDEAIILLKKLKVSKIVLNNLAGYWNQLEVLDLIADLKNNYSAKVSFRAHDFQCLCPNITMVGADNKFCDIQYLSQCSNCQSIKDNKTEIDTINGIEEWHKKWQFAFENTIDEAIFFSLSTQDIITRLYACLESKKNIIPHFVAPLEVVKSRKHKRFNIAILGSISKIKGADIIEEMAQLISRSKIDAKLHVIGIINCKNKKNIKVHGKYERCDLPKIMGLNKIDIIFIPSIWPETFSYTTSEAMAMGLPVACFNIGAPVERVSLYEKGLIISQIDAETALREICDFLKERREKLILEQV